MSAGCDGRYWASDRPCQALAQWHVRVGSREVDAMRACPRHLSAVCVTMLGAEGRRGAALTVRSLPLPDHAVREVAVAAYAALDEVTGAPGAGLPLPPEWAP